MFINIQYSLYGGQKIMNDKLRDSLQYLKSLSFIENEAFKLYETLSKKINQPESSFIFGIGCDSQKNAKIIQSILDRFDLPEQDNKDFMRDLSELATQILTLEKKVSKINNLEYLISCEMLKEAINLEALLSEVYTKYLKSSSTKIVVDELSKTGLVNLANFRKLFEYFNEEKGKHKETIVEIMYLLEAKEIETRRPQKDLVMQQIDDKIMLDYATAAKYEYKYIRSPMMLTNYL